MKEEGIAMTHHRDSSLCLLAVIVLGLCWSGIARGASAAADSAASTPRVIGHGLPAALFGAGVALVVTDFTLNDRGDLDSRHLNRWLGFGMCVAGAFGLMQAYDLDHACAMPFSPGARGPDREWVVAPGILPLSSGLSAAVEVRMRF